MATASMANPEEMSNAAPDQAAASSPNLPAQQAAAGQSQPLTAASAGTGQPPRQAQPPVSVVSAPDIVKPSKRGGLAGFMDDMADAIAGTKGAGRVYTDPKTGDEYIEHPTLSRKQQWLKIAGEALRGGAAGAAHAQGPGGAWRGAAAGIEAGDQQADKEQAQEKEMQGDVRQHNVDLFNRVKAQHDMAAQEFSLQRLKVQATESDIKFAQEQQDRMDKLAGEGKAYDLGSYADEAALARVKEVNPNFWKDAYKGDITVVPELDVNGNRKGIHVYQTTPGIGNELVEPGTSFKVFTPGAKPGDPPTMQDQVPTQPMTWNQKHAYDLSAMGQMQKWQTDQAELKLKASEAAKNQAETGDEGLKRAHMRAETAHEIAETAKLNRDATDEKTEDQLVQEIRAGQIAPERISYMLGRKDGQQLLARVAQNAGTDTSKLAAYPKLFQDFTSGKTSQQLRNLNTAFQHIEDLRGLNSNMSRMPGSEASHAFENKLVNASAEIANALAKPGASATKEEIAQVKKSLSPFLNRDSAITTQIHSMVEQYKTLRNVWADGAPSATYEAKMPDLSPEAKQIVRKYSPQDANGWWGRPVVQGGRVIGYSKDGKTMEPASGGVQ